jgi:hypothetical protein
MKDAGNREAVAADEEGGVKAQAGIPADRQEVGCGVAIRRGMDLGNVFRQELAGLGEAAKLVEAVKAALE